MAELTRLYRDLDHFDAAMDEFATGDDIFTDEYGLYQRPLRNHFHTVAGLGRDRSAPAAAEPSSAAAAGAEPTFHASDRALGVRSLTTTNGD